MMPSKGMHGNARIRSRTSVEITTSDPLTPAQKAASGLVTGYFDSHGWGFGVSVVTPRDEVTEPVGRFGWDGGLGMSWYCSPGEDMTTILLPQRAWTPAAPPDAFVDFRTLTHRAIEDRALVPAALTGKATRTRE